MTADATHSAWNLATLGGAVLIAAFLAAPVAAADPLWKPRPLPAGCSAANVHLLIQDVSGSMLMDHLLDSALDQQANYVLQAPHCTYLIYAEFGSTARVVAHNFLMTPQGRLRIAAEIRSRPQTHQNTNFDEAAKLVELTLMKVERAYTGTAWSFTVSVISDHIPDPSEGHTAFDLQDYLTQPPLDERIDVLRVEIVKSGTLPLSEEIRAGHMTVSVDGLSELLETLVPSAQPQEDRASPMAVKTPSSPMGATDRLPAWSWQASVALALLTLLVALVRLRRKGPGLPEIDAPDSRFPQDRAPQALRLSEHVVDRTGTVVETLRDREEIPVAEGVPVVFSTANDADVQVRDLPGDVVGKIFSVTPEADGRLRLHGTKGTNLNGRELRDPWLVVEALTPLRIDVGNRRWIITPVWSDVGRLDQLLAVPQHE
jgi:hypothetical protein